MEEYGVPSENLFWTMFFTTTEGRNLIELYLRNVDPLGLIFVTVSYIICLSLGLLTLSGFLLAIVFVAIIVGLYMALVQTLWLFWRYIISPLAYLLRTTYICLLGRPRASESTDKTPR